MEGNEKTSAKVIPRCLEWRDLHNRLRSPMQSIGERQGLLVQVKWAAREAGCDLKREVADLIYREASMLDRGMPEESLAGLRRNLASLFLEVIVTQEKKQREEQKQAEEGDHQEVIVYQWIHVPLWISLTHSKPGMRAVQDACV